MTASGDPVLEVKFLRPTRRYTRIQGALANLNHSVGRGTIANVLKRHGIEPAPERSRRTPWVDVSQGALESARCQ